MRPRSSSLEAGHLASTVGGREQLAIEAFASAMEIIPWALAENAGLDAIDMVIQLKSAHEKKGAASKNMGLDLDAGKPVDMLKANVIEPLGSRPRPSSPRPRSPT